MEVLRCCGGRDAPASGAEDDGGRAGDMGPDGTGVDVPDGWEDEPCFFLCFLREDSVPLASERLGEPGRFRALVDAFLRGSGAFNLLDGVLVPFVEAPEIILLASFDFRLSLSEAAFLSSSFLRSSSFRRSVSVSSDSLCLDH